MPDHASGQPLPEWVTWACCDQVRKDGTPCTGAAQADYGRCLVHLDGTRLASVLTRRLDEALPDLDARGVRLTTGDLRRLLAAARRLGVLGGVSLQRATVKGDVFLNTTRVEGGVSLTEATVEGDVFLNGATVEGDVFLTGATVEGDVGLFRATVKGDVSFAAAAVKGSVGLFRATVKGRVSLTEATVERVVSLERATVKGDVSLKRATAKNNVVLSTATVEGGVSLERATVKYNVVLIRKGQSMSPSPRSDSRADASARGPRGYTGSGFIWRRWRWAPAPGST